MPLLPPVISAVFPSSLPMCASPSMRCGRCRTSASLRTGALDIRCICAYVCAYAPLSRTDQMPASSLPKPDECNCFMVRSAARHVTQLYDQILAPVGLRVTQFSILAKLKRLEPLTINALAKDMVMDRTTLSRNVLPLERDGLIKIQASAADGRAKELQLTN